MANKVGPHDIDKKGSTRRTARKPKSDSGRGIRGSTPDRETKACQGMEETLRAASLYARSLIEVSLDPLVTISPAGKITDVNRATEEATGIPRQDLVGRDFWDYFTEPDKARAGYQQVLAEGSVRDYPLTLRHNSGRLMDVLYNAATYTNEAGEVQGVFAAARDVTERKKAEATVAAERRRFYNVLEMLPAYIVLLTPDYHVPFANRYFVERFGESRGKRCFEYLFGRTEPCENCETYKVLKTNAPHRWEWTGPDGRNYDIYDFPFPDVDGSPLILEMGIDITERKDAERQISKLNEELEQRVRQRTVQLEAVNKELEAFSYSVSHDLRAPLRAMSGFSNIILEKYQEALDDEGKDYLRRIIAATARMGQLIDDILKLSRLTRTDMQYARVDLSAEARKILKELQSQQPERQVELVITDGLEVNGDPSLLHVTLENLLLNAWKFSGKRPQARIEFGVIEKDGKRSFFVRDNGAGFDMAFADKLFEAFQRLHSPTEFPGTGIGLAIVKRAINRHGGEVWAEGAVDRGATFYFALPQGEGT